MKNWEKKEKELKESSKISKSRKKLFRNFRISMLDLNSKKNVDVYTCIIYRTRRLKWIEEKEN